MGTSTLSLDLSVCICVHNYEVDITANKVGQIQQGIRVAIDTHVLPAKHCCVPLSWLRNCRISQLDVVQSSWHCCTSDPVDHADWSLPLHLPSFLEPDLVVLCGKFREAQIGWTQLSPRLLVWSFVLGKPQDFMTFSQSSTMTSGLNWLVHWLYEVCMIDWRSQWSLFSWF